MKYRLRVVGNIGKKITLNLKPNDIFWLYVPIDWLRHDKEEDIITLKQPYTIEIITTKNRTTYKILPKE